MPAAAAAAAARQKRTVKQKIKKHLVRITMIVVVPTYKRQWPMIVICIIIVCIL